MSIEYKNTKDFEAKDLEDLFLSVEWSSGHYPKKLVIAMKNFDSVFSAWDGDKLVGMVCVMDDGIMNAYIHYVLVNPEYHGQGIGHSLMNKMKLKYTDYMRIIVIAYDKEKEFYKSCGFEGTDDKSPMFITDLWT